MHFSLLPLQDEDGNEVEGWYRFSVRSLGGNGTWAENSRGLVSVVTEAEDVDEALIPDQESFLQGRRSAEKLEGSGVRARVAEMGVEYGPAFHGLVDSNAAAASGALPRAVANLRLNSLGSLEESEADDPNTTSYVIHPTTLDCIVQATYSNLPRGTGKMAMVLPRFIEEMFIPQLLNREIGESLTVFSELRKTESTGFASNVSVVNTMDQEEKYGGPLPLMEISRLFCQAIPRVRAIEDDGPGVRLWDTRWEQDVWHDGIPASIKDSMRVTLDNEDAAWEKKLVKASYHLIHDAVTILEGPNLTQEAWTPDRRVVFSWMKTIVEQDKAGTLASSSKLWQRSSKGVKQILFDELQAKGGTNGNLLIRVGQQLGAIVRGDMITPPEALEKGDKAGDLRVQYHQDLSGLRVRGGTHLGKLVRSFAVIKPGLKVLEVGAGDGTLAQTILKSSGNHGDGTSLIDQYILTNSTSALFDAAKQKLTAWEEAVKYRGLDFEDGQAIAKISSELKADVIVASLFQLQFSNFKATLNNVRSLLSPGGKLLLVEPTQGRLDMQLMVKALALTETKTEYPMPLLAWDEKLKTNQFTGLELTVDDCEQQQHRGFSVFVTSAPPPTKNGAVNGVDGKITASLILHPSSFPSVSQQPWVSRVIDAVQARTGLNTVVESFDLAQPDDKKVAPLATDLEGETLLDSLDETQFSQLRQILLGSRGVLWEDTDRAYGLLDLPRNWTTSAKSDIGAVGIARVLQKILHEDTSEAADWEYALGDYGSFYLPRVHPVQVHENATSETKPGLSLPFQSSEHSLVWDDAASSFIGKLRQQEAKETPAGMIEIDVKAFSPRHPPKTANDENAATPYEVSGVVVGFGNNTKASGLQLGDNVCGLAAPGTRVTSTVRAPSTTITRVPDGISLEMVACMPLAYATAYHALVHVARLQDNDRVMILHAIENLDSEATIGLAAQIGADVSIVTHNGSDSDAIQLSEHYHIPMERILIKPSTKTLNGFILGQTNGLGVDVLVNAVSLPKSQSKLGRLGEDIIARFGRVVDLGGAQSHELDVKQFAARCASYARVDVIQLAQHNGKVMRQALDAAFQFLSRSNTASLTPPSLSGVAQYPVSELKDALEFSQEKHVPVLVVPKPDSVVKVLPPSHSFSLTYEDGTYLVCGGVGGIGSTIALSMVSKGARNVIVVSRNAESHPATEFLVEDARQKGCHLKFVNCDVSDEQSVISLVHRISASSPPIRGAVHAAAVLEDTIFEQMTFAQWQSALKPKVAGARNLHRHLPSDLSFFVLLSSITGVVGHPSQANYAAANTFEDALVRERAAQGLAGISLDLPAITGAGMVGDNAEAHRRVEALGTESMPIEKALDLIETAILRDVDRQRRQSQAHLNHETSASDGEVVQLIAGLQPWSLLSPDATVHRDKRFGTLRLMGSTSASASDDPSSAGSISDPTTLLIQALSRSKDENDAGAKENAVVDALAARLAAIFSVPVETIDLGLTIAGHGVDSLVAVDLRNWLASAGKAKLSIFDILQSPSLKHLAGLVVGKSGLSK
ncbi:putative PKS/NRPS-like protein biosynthetic cluster [Aspergillus melleus]|uniref:PKS/NRPS-like protein biosynthetic cluster n=1 Tax=Aspergillus melleus TaxID=138277 RepID=A0ACC3B0H3_9EURO|nr:putative PKS/NRPS-like protein biosynthetic cluster [Aspergillus melleus]